VRRKAAKDDAEVLMQGFDGGRYAGTAVVDLGAGGQVTDDLVARNGTRPGPQVGGRISEVAGDDGDRRGIEGLGGGHPDHDVLEEALREPVERGRARQLVGRADLEVGADRVGVARVDRHGHGDPSWLRRAGQSRRKCPLTRSKSSKRPNSPP
jgi:hypothetical protein